MSEPLDLLERMYDALRSPLGIVLETEDPERLRQRLYALRKDRPDLARVSFILSPTNPRHLWLLVRPE